MSDEEIQYAAVCFPGLADVDRDWIESVRRQYDPKSALIPAHLTIVFPQNRMVGEDFENRIATLAEQSASFTVRFTELRAIREPGMTVAYAYLVPSGLQDGSDSVTDLYTTGPMTGHCARH
ncbi:MAG: 2'-5' RNA ligase family protein [Alphaproteobacteria bacterium]